MGLVAPAALSGLVMTMLTGGGTTAGRSDVIAVVVGFVAVRRTENVLYGFALGLLVFAATTLAL
jgi:hypothetical protein